MGEIINLNKARKARDKAADKARAAENRAAHGRSKSERTQAEAEKSHLDQVLDGARRERPDDASDD